MSGLATLARRPPGHAAPALPRWPLAPAAVLLRSGLQIPLFVALDLVAPAEVAGREVLAGLAPPVIFAANHTSHLDTPAVLRALPARWRRRVAVAAAADYFFQRPLPGLGAALLFNAFPFARTPPLRPTLENCARLLEQGWSLLLFPEGTRSPSGEIGPFKRGVGLLAVELGVPVVPVRLDGLARVLPKGRWLPRPGRVAVRFGAPLRFEAASASLAARAVEQAVRAL